MIFNNKYFLGLSRYIKKKGLTLFNRHISLAENVAIDWSTKIYNNGNQVVLGKNVYLRSIRTRYQAAMYFPTTLLLDVKGSIIEIGENSRINGVYIHAQKHIRIGSNCVIASGVNIMDSNGHEVYSLNRVRGRDKPESIFIGNNVWIGLNAIILKGTRIGDNCVVTAGSVVKGVIPDNTIVQGNPATVVKTFDLTNIK